MESCARLMLVKLILIGGPSYLVLHRDEWNRLKKKAGPPDEPSQENNDYLKGLIEQSQAWIRKWPDTVEGHVANMERQKEKKRAEELALVNAFALKKVRYNATEAIKKARQKIFANSNYGKQLLAALRESKCLEERDVQTEFLKKLKLEAAELDQKFAQQELGHCYFGSATDPAEIEQEKKKTLKNNARENQEIYEKHKETIKKAANHEKSLELEDAQMMKRLLEEENKAHLKVKQEERKMMAEYANEDKKIKAENAKRDAEREHAIKQIQKEKDKLECKLQRVHKILCCTRVNDPTSTRVYEIIETERNKDKKRYDDFIDVQLKKGEERGLKREKREKEKQMHDREKRHAMAETNKKLAEYERMVRCDNKYFCDRQCLLSKSHKQHLKKITTETKSSATIQPDFSVRNKLTAALRNREKEPSPYTGSNAAHNQFATEAEDFLRECKYKTAGRKVVDEYRKYNGLDAATLPIPSYY